LEKSTAHPTTIIRQQSFQPMLTGVKFIEACKKPFVTPSVVATHLNHTFSKGTLTNGEHPVVVMQSSCYHLFM
jgi:hypothetical protein